MAVEFENSEELFSTQIGNIGLTAAAFEYFGLAEVIELWGMLTKSWTPKQGDLYIQSNR